MTPPPPKLVLGLALALASLPLIGCELPAALASFTGERVPAHYQLRPRRTLVMVDDPDVRLGDPGLANVVAANITHQLRQHKALAGEEEVSGSLVPQRELVALTSRLDDDYQRLPIDRVGRELGAKQVIHVAIRSVSLQAAPGLYRPTVVAEVRVIDSQTGQRLFPESDTLPGPDAPGHRIRLQMPHRSVSDAGQDSLVARTLAQRLGKDIAKLFYAHKKPEPGHTLGREDG